MILRQNRISETTLNVDESNTISSQNFTVQQSKTNTFLTVFKIFIILFFSTKRQSISIRNKNHCLSTSNFTLSSISKDKKKENVCMYQVHTNEVKTLLE